MIKKIFAPAKNSGSANFALFVLRVWIGLEMCLLHGADKLMHFNKYAAMPFADPFGIGPSASLALSVFAEFFASLLLVLGLFTRFGALVLIINMTVAFITAHHGALTGAHGGELAFVYLLVYVVIFLAGPGRFSADKLLFGKNSTTKLQK
jgi:putative oxidoreductase